MVMTQGDQNLPEVSPAHIGESASLRAVRERFECSFIVRAESEKDYGVDGTIELLRLDSQTRKVFATNRRACFQLKHTSREASDDQSVSCRITVKNLNYLAAHPPAFYLLFVTCTSQLLFRWWQDIYNELLETQRNWEEQSTVTVRFSRPIDEGVLDEIRVETDAHAEQVKLLRDGPGLVRHFHGNRLPESMLPNEPFYDRTQELAAMASQTIRGSIIPIWGPPESGKTEVVRHYVSSAANMERQNKRLGGPIALLAIDVRPRVSPRRLLRALSYALGVSKLDSFSEIGPEDDPTRQVIRARLLEEVLPARLQQLLPLTVIDNVDACFGDAINRDDFIQVVNCNALRNGATIVIGHGTSLPGFPIRRVVQPGVHVDSLPIPEAGDLLGVLIDGKSVASEVIRELSDFHELLRPGAIRRGADLFKSRLTRYKDVPRKEMLSESLLDATGDMVRETLAFLQYDTIMDAHGAIGALGSLLVISILPELPLRLEWLELSGLPLSGLQSLVEFGWVEHKESYRLTRAATRALRQEVSRILSNGSHSAEVSVIEQGLESLLTQTEQHLAEGDIELYGRAVEEGLSWLKETVPTASGIGARLVTALIPHVADDLVFPISTHELASVSELLRSMDGARKLDACILGLVSAARFQHDAEYFVKCLRETSEVALNNPELTVSQFRALDTATFIGQQRHRRYREILEIRVTLLPKIAQLSVGKLRQVATLKWSASYILNTATLALGLGQIELTRGLVDNAKATIDQLPVPNTRYGLVDYGWLRARLLQLEARISSDRETRVQKLYRSAESALLSLANSGGQFRWVRFYLRRMHLLIQELWTDADRDQTLETALARLREEFSDVSEWPLDVRTQAAALSRDTASLAADPAERLQSAKMALELLVPAAHQAIAIAKLGDTRSLLTLSRSYAFAGTCLDAVGEIAEAKRCLHEALRFVSIALESSPSAPAWELKLRLLEQGQLPNYEDTWHIEPLAAARNQMGTELRREIKECWVWLEMQNSWGGQEGRLAIWCREREWREQGSLERWASATLSDGRDWQTLDNHSRRSILTQTHRTRQNKLLSIKTRTGPFPELLLAFARRESQYQRLMAVYGNHVYNSNGALKYLQEASKLWPDNHTIVAGEARIYRYVWDYPNAIHLFRRLVTSWPNSEKRRQATVDLIETLLTSALHGDVLGMPDGTKVDRSELLSEAEGLLTDVTHFRNIASDVAILRDRVAFETGQDIDWPAIDATYSLVVGDVNLYAPTVVKNLSELQNQESKFAEHITDLVRQDFTGPEVLRGMGLLYLRRAEKRASDNPVADCQKAYAVFDACRILENAFLGSGGETVVTSYQRGRAILVASTISQSIDPFAAYLYGKRSLLCLAESLFQRAISLSVGHLHFEARKRASEATHLKRQLAQGKRGPNI